MGTVSIDPTSSGHRPHTLGLAVIARAQALTRRRRLMLLAILALVAVNALALAVCLILGTAPVALCVLSGALGLGLSSMLAWLMAWDWHLADRVLRATDAARRRCGRLAYADPLTGLPNRRALQRELLRWCAGEDRSVQGFALHLVDVDELKQINDRFGHAAGDAVLRTVAQHLAASVRQSDLVVRLAGDEFVVLQREASASTAERLAARMVEELRRPLGDDLFMLVPTVSVGTAVAGRSPEEPETLLRAADEALYVAKARGRDGYVLTDLSSRPAAQRAAFANA